MSTLPPPEWQNVIRARLMAAQAARDPCKDIIEQYQQLAAAARELKVRNRALLRSGGGGGDGPAPLVSHLDAQLNTLRAEISGLYRTQAAAQNKQLALSDALRDRDEEVRGLREEVRQLRETRDVMTRREQNTNERLRVKDDDAKVLHDEILALQIEFSGLTQRNSALQADNASLLQRWLDKMNMTVDEMNAEFEAEASASKDEGDFRGGGKAAHSAEWEVVDSSSAIDDDDDDWAEARASVV
ncbi:hypothetical protein CcaverHIS631_0210140 [Cutaneotrichosporon cavernicola]|nr:hypothetical protein CcaverHIS631_0210140 [Cutaneotrichosporon cavernicola]